MDTWKLHSRRKAPHIVDLDIDAKDGNKAPILRDSTTDSFEGRIAFFGNMACRAPGWNGSAKLA